MRGAGSKKHLTKTSNIDPEASDFELGNWTEAERGTMLKSGSMAEWSDITQNCHVGWPAIGKMCSIANASRINPGKHPTWRAAQHHSVTILSGKIETSIA